MRILVTGGTGFVGSHLVEKFLGEGHDVVVAKRHKSNTRWLPLDKIEFFDAPVDNPENLKQILPSVDAVVHAAGLTKAKSREDFFRVNADGTRKMLQLCAENCNNSLKFVLVSSLAAAGCGSADENITESSAENPDHMLAEGRALNAEQEETRRVYSNSFFEKARFKSEERTAFKALIQSISPLKKLAYLLAGEEGLRMLAIPGRMPRTREKVRSTARAMLSAWEEHSADPVFSSLTHIFDQLQATYDAHLAAWNAQEDARCLYSDKVRSYAELRKRGNKFISDVKRYISVYYDAYEDSWLKYGFEPRKKKGE